MKRSSYNLAKSFYFAIAGIFYALRHERNLRIHFAVAALVLYLTRYYELSRAEYALLFLVIGFVITSEMMNTAVEKTVDMETPVYSSLAKVAKDVAAGAVFVSGVTAVGVAGVLLWDVQALLLILSDIMKAPVIWLACAAIAWLWIFLPGRTPNKKRHTRQRERL